MPRHARVFLPPTLCQPLPPAPSQRIPATLYFRFRSNALAYKISSWATSPKNIAKDISVRQMETKCNRHDQLVWSRWLTAFTTQWSTVCPGGNLFPHSAALPHECGVCACPFLIYSITNWNLCTNVYLEEEMPTKVGCKSQQKICQFHNAADSRNSWSIEELYRWSLAPLPLLHGQEERQAGKVKWWIHATLERASDTHIQQKRTHTQRGRHINFWTSKIEKGTRLWNTTQGVNVPRLELSIQWWNPSCNLKLRVSSQFLTSLSYPLRVCVNRVLQLANACCALRSNSWLSVGFRLSLGPPSWVANRNVRKSFSSHTQTHARTHRETRNWSK